VQHGGGEGALLNRREVPVVPAPVLATAATHASA